MKRFFKPWVIIVLVIVVASGGVFTYMKLRNKSSISYKTSQVTKGTLTVSVSGSGNVVVDKSENVNPSISGQVYDLAVKYGDHVEKGQTLFKIKNDQLDITLSQAYASYLQAKQTVSSNEYKLTQAQNNKNSVDNDAKSTDTDKADAAQKITEAESTIELSNINADNAYKNYELQKKNAALRTVTAPISGTITTLNIKNGDQLGSSGSSGQSSSSSSSSSGSSSTPIVIADLGTLKASVSINEVDAASVKADQKATMTFDAIDDLTLTGKVERISTIGTESSGVVTYPATITFDSLDDRVKPQMSLTANITTEVKQDVLTVPSSAVKSSSDTSYVLVMENGSPVQKTVEVGISNDTSTEIKSGLSEGETIVTQTITASSESSSSSSSSSGKSSNSLNLRGLTDSGGGGFPGNASGPPTGN